MAERLVGSADLCTTRNPDLGWVHVSTGGSGDRTGTFATGCVAELDGSRLVGLWLRPTTV